MVHRFLSCCTMSQEYTRLSYLIKSSTFLEEPLHPRVVHIDLLFPTAKRTLRLIFTKQSRWLLPPAFLPTNERSNDKVTFTETIGGQLWYEDDSVLMDKVLSLFGGEVVMEIGVHCFDVIQACSEL